MSLNRRTVRSQAIRASISVLFQVFVVRDVVDHRRLEPVPSFDAPSVSARLISASSNSPGPSSVRRDIGGDGFLPNGPFEHPPTFPPGVLEVCGTSSDVREWQAIAMRHRAR